MKEQKMSNEDLDPFEMYLCGFNSAICFIRSAVLEQYKAAALLDTIFQLEQEYQRECNAIHRHRRTIFRSFDW